MSDTDSSEANREENNSDNEIFCNEYFDPLLYINTNFKERNLNEFHNTLVDLKESINKNKMKNQELVRRHFSKFVHCRESVDDIRENDIFGYIKSVFDQIDHNLLTLKNKMAQISSIHGVNVHINDSGKKRREILQFYKKILELEEQLKYDLKYSDFAGFVKHYNSAIKLKNGSKFLDMKLKDAEKIKKQFLEILVAEIEKNVNVDDTVFYFKLYFKIEKTECNKLENTLFILIKKFLAERKKISEMECVLIYIFKNLSIVNSFLIEERILRSLIDWADRCVLNEFSVLDYRNSVEKLRIFCEMIKPAVKPSNLCVFRDAIEKIKEKMSEKVFAKMDEVFRLDIENDQSNLDDFLQSINDFMGLNNIKDNLYLMAENLLKLETVVESFSNIRIGSEESCSRATLEPVEVNFRYCLIYSEKVSKIRKKLKKSNKFLNNSLNFRRIEKIIKKKELSMIKAFLENIKNGSIEYNLMTFLKLHELYALNKRVSGFLDPEILKCNVIRFFLCNILEIKEPKLNEEEQKKTEEIFAQFSCLRDV